jgi:hypothetical protein
MGKLLKAQCLGTNDSKMEEHTNDYQHFIESIQEQQQKSAFSLLGSLNLKEQINNKHNSFSSSFNIEDILNSNQNYRNFNNENKNDSHFPKSNIDNDFILSEMEHNENILQDRGYVLKENSEEIGVTKVPFSKNNYSRKPNEKTSSSSYSSASSSSSSYCSPIQSVCSSYSSYQSQNENPIQSPTSLINSTDFFVKNFAYFNNPFVVLNNGQFNSNYHKHIENNSQYTDPFMNQIAAQHQLLSKKDEHGKNYLTMEDLIKTTLSSKILNKDYNEDKVLDVEKETKKKIVIIDEIAKKIDAISESANNKNLSKCDTNNQKNQSKTTKKPKDKNKKKDKSEKFGKKKEKILNEEDEEDIDCSEDGRICGCSDLACCKLNFRFLSLAIYGLFL